MAMVASSSTKRIVGKERFLEFEIGYQVIVTIEGVMNFLPRVYHLQVKSS